MSGNSYNPNKDDSTLHPIDLENRKGAGEGSNASVNSIQNDGRIVEINEERDLSRSLKQRHIQMIALAGAVCSLCSRL